LGAHINPPVVAAAQPPSAPAKKLVLVDDEKSFTDLLAQILVDHLDCTVESFIRPNDALTAVDWSNVGMLVTDYYMPVMSGLELIERVQKTQPGVPAILITGHPLKLASEEQRRVPSMRAILPKPFGWRRLADLVITHWPDELRPSIRSRAF
jgi:DNA-binding NtrC family response regulator